ncbi:hypothetical protein MSAN_02315100 [Mycena sanguinolenta]|uniref:Uncharacterized protein n=1 Tax=Mycena sanguinolenta TaxID=230812 RepID=A0A8H6X873_9AGAR|nr:hypothetical protein MSAN_02315100 [Mycena sanguinolenta]
MATSVSPPLLRRIATRFCNPAGVDQLYAHCPNLKVIEMEGGPAETFYLSFAPLPPSPSPFPFHLPLPLALLAAPSPSSRPSSHTPTPRNISDSPALLPPSPTSTSPTFSTSPTPSAGVAALGLGPRTAVGREWIRTNCTRVRGRRRDPDAAQRVVTRGWGTFRVVWATDSDGFVVRVPSKNNFNDADNDTEEWDSDSGVRQQERESARQFFFWQRLHLIVFLLSRLSFDSGYGSVGGKARQVSGSGGGGGVSGVSGVSGRGKTREKHGRSGRSGNAREVKCIPGRWDGVGRCDAALRLRFGHDTATTAEKPQKKLAQSLHPSASITSHSKKEGKGTPRGHRPLSPTQ